MKKPRVISGKVKRAPCVVVYGPDGVGKTGFAAFSERPIFIEAERGSGSYDVDRFAPPKDYLETLGLISYLINDQEHAFKTLVIDSTDWLERLLHKQIVAKYKTSSMATAAGGYGKAYTEAAEKFGDFFSLIDKLRDERNMNVIFICHSETTKYEDPEHQASYERYGLKMHKQVSDMFREYADAILFTNDETFVTTEEGSKKARAFGSDSILMHVRRRPGYDAKNRYGLTEPFEHIYGQGWTDFVDLIKDVDTQSPEIILKRIEELKPRAPEELLPKIEEAIAKSTKNSSMLLVIEKRLEHLIKLEDEKEA